MIGVGTFRATDRMRALVGQVLDTGRISYGPMSLEFEKRFAARHACQYAILSNSGTSALQVALQAMKEIHRWRDGDHVLVPATTFVATANIVIHNKLIPVFVDADPITYNIDPALIERYITDRTRAIIPAHLFGQAADMTRIMEIAKLNHLKVIEDSCETMFVGHHGRPVGSWGDIGCFSTYVAHLIVTGVGGLSITDNPDYAAKMRSLVNHGLALDCLNPGENFSPQPAGNRRFRFESIGHSYRITELEAALGLAQMDEIDNSIAIRQRNARHYTAGLERIVNGLYGNPVQTPQVADGNEHAFMMYPIVLRKQGGKHVSKEPLMKFLGDSGIETRDMLPLINQPAYKLRLRASDYPVSQWIVDSGLYIGCHQDLTPADIQYTADKLAEFFHGEYTRVEPINISTGAMQPAGSS